MGGMDNRQRWLRLGASLALMTLGCGAQYAMSVALVPVQQEFGISRADATLPYTMALIGFGLGSILMGRVADRLGVFVAVLIGAVSVGLGFVLAGMAGSLAQLVVVFALPIGLLGISAVFAPLIADTSLWFTRNRGMAVAICSSGNYLAGAAWPPALQYFISLYGWRATFIGAGIFCLATMLPLAFVLRNKRRQTPAPSSADLHSDNRPPTANSIQVLLCLAGFACCAAMAMPQFHIVALCTDLGYAAARGAEMISLVLGFGIVSRLASGWLCDRIGALRTLALGSTLQVLALMLFLPSSSLSALYAASIFFGIVQGGIVPAYAVIARERFPASETGWRTGAIMMATQLGMAFGGWVSGAIFDFTGSYNAAFVHAIAWNLANLAIVACLFVGLAGPKAKVSPVLR
jgi:MFS family permease